MSIDRSLGMKQICRELLNKGIDLVNLDALEVFAREGDWQTFVYSGKVKSLTAWEINREFEAGLRRNLPKAKVEIVDSVEKLKNYINGKFGFIVIDNPQNTFGKNNEYCEHFDILPNINNVIEKEALVIFNVNSEPFDLENYPIWKKRREEFYKITDTSKLSLFFLMNFYRNYFDKEGFDTGFIFSIFREECKPLSYLHYIVIWLIKR
ncbi:MAG: hypothetical protein U0W24_07290 [Bacteroidales bacterium]